MASPHGPLKLGIGGPVGAGKTTLTAALARRLKDEMSVAVITNDIYTQEDAEALMRMQILPADRVMGSRRGAARIPRSARMRRSTLPPWRSCGGGMRTLT
jgi:urease accessory protein